MDLCIESLLLAEVFAEMLTLFFITIHGHLVDSG